MAPENMMLLATVIVCAGRWAQGKNLSASIVVAGFLIALMISIMDDIPTIRPVARQLTYLVLIGVSLTYVGPMLANIAKGSIPATQKVAGTTGGNGSGGSLSGINSDAGTSRSLTGAAVSGFGLIGDALNGNFGGGLADIGEGAQNVGGWVQDHVPIVGGPLGALIGVGGTVLRDEGTEIQNRGFLSGSVHAVGDVLSGMWHGLFG